MDNYELKKRMDKKIAILIKDNELLGYPADLLIDGEVVKSYNLEFECEMKGIELIIGKSMPSDVIKALRDKGVMFLKINSLDEIDGLDYDIIIPKEFNKKRGWGCSVGFKVPGKE